MIGKLKDIFKHIFNDHNWRTKFENNNAVNALILAISHSTHRTSISYFLKASA
ncbi:protein of unknown function [Bartonella clarridgeiae 73]|uniref:Uncharacterized protein n=1 Tax=Bartonella clarridgeiae (strain CCUG 45776 / CIP 104772 / 73) TaxID=696125 RepID=E6YJ64_BARC7|nr:hypothetical protein [Bartonella clarridgeiae]WCR55860.1 MAG: hypothetical protein PG977_001253 [Bartonella clarridgeiae]CBI76902.1 protein of unknown function [Bartonella clarridgeiae 73]